MVPISQYDQTPAAPASGKQASPEVTIITSPTVRIISRPVWDYTALDSFLQEQGSSWFPDTSSSGDALPEIAGRLCYLSYNSPRPGGNQAYLEHILDSKHYSVLEHSCYGLLITGVSRSLTHELIRHRHLSPSQLSQRYVDESDVAFVLPPAIGRSYRAYQTRQRCYTQPDLLQQQRDCQLFIDWRDACVLALSSYRALLTQLDASAPDYLAGTERKKWARQTARSVLPNCTETKIMLTGNLRAWRDAILQRATPAADSEIRSLFYLIYDLLRHQAPSCFADCESFVCSAGLPGVRLRS